MILIGIDHSYREEGLPGKPVESQSDDVDHFHPDYFGRGIVWQLPNYAAMEHGYKQAKRLFEMDNRVIVDCTVEGKLDIFPKEDFRAFIESSKARSKN